MNLVLSLTSCGLIEHFSCLKKKQLKNLDGIAKLRNKTAAVVFVVMGHLFLFLFFKGNCRSK